MVSLLPHSEWKGCFDEKTNYFKKNSNQFRTLTICSCCICVSSSYFTKDPGRGLTKRLYGEHWNLYFDAFIKSLGVSFSLNSKCFWVWTLGKMMLTISAQSFTASWYEHSLTAHLPPLHWKDMTMSFLAVFFLSTNVVF